MVSQRQTFGTWCSVACLLWLSAGCAAVAKNPLAKKTPEPATTAVSGSGNFASNDGVKDPSKVFLAYGQWQEQMGQQAEARESYGKVLADNPKNVEALLGMARLDQAAGLMDDAEVRLKKATKLSPKDPRVLAAYGNFYAAQQDWPKSIEKLQAAVKQVPEDPRYQFLLAVSMARSGDVDQSFPFFVRAVGDAQAHFNVGYILYEQGDRAAGERHFNQALALKPDLAPAQNMLDRIHQRQGNTQLVNGTDESETSATGVRTIPLDSQELQLPVHGTTPTPVRPMLTHRIDSAPQPPAGLTPAQQEQRRNQQGQ